MIYLAQSSLHRFTKIGYSKTPPKREKTLQAHEPDLKFICILNGERWQEAFYHKAFCEKRIRGEWFDLSNEDIYWIKINQGSFDEIQQISPNIYSEEFKQRCNLLYFIIELYKNDCPTVPIHQYEQYRWRNNANP